MTQSPYDNSSPYAPPPHPFHNAKPAIPGDWPAVSRAHLIAFGIGVALFLLLILVSRQNFVWAIDHANVAIHETGHFVFKPFGRMMYVWGGTLFQCIVPLAFGVYFWRRRQTAGVAVAGLWLGKNLLHIAVYMADAKRQVLPLVGGNNHDWWYIFIRMGGLDQCETIAAVVKTTGWLIMLASAAWYVWRWRVGVAYSQVSSQ